MKIAITAPAGPVNQEKIHRGIKVLKQIGYEDVIVGETCRGQHYWNSAIAEKEPQNLFDFGVTPA